MIRDHDYLETPDSWIFCVVGEVHPPDSYLAYLKYIPGEGPWRRGEESFQRVIGAYSTVEFAETLNMLRVRRPNYVKRDPHINSEMSMVPKDEVVRYYRCGEAAKRLLARSDVDWLEEKACRLIREVMDLAGLETDDVGITGSILLGIHHRSSDIDLIIYGEGEFWRAWKALNEAGYMGRLGGEVLHRLLSRYPIGRRDAENLLSRMRNKGIYMGTGFSIHGVRKPHEITERYCEKTYLTIGPAKGELRIRDSRASCFTPAVYEVDGCVECGGKAYPVRRLVCYDLTFATLFRPGDRVEAAGKLEKVRERSGEAYFILLVGSTLTAGREYVRLI